MGLIPVFKLGVHLSLLVRLESAIVLQERGQLEENVTIPFTSQLSRESSVDAEAWGLG